MSAILLLDDNCIFREPVAAMLRMKGHSVACCDDGLEGLTALEAGLPDLVLLDLAMPRMDGLSFLRKLRATTGGANVPVIVLTATTDRQYIAVAKELGIQGHLLKSRFSLEDMQAQIDLCVAPPTGRREASTPAV